jgi:hypothetical protein
LWCATTRTPSWTCTPTPSKAAQQPQQVQQRVQQSPQPNQQLLNQQPIQQSNSESSKTGQPKKTKSRRQRRLRRQNRDNDEETEEVTEVRTDYRSSGSDRISLNRNNEDSYLKQVYNNPEIVLDSALAKTRSEQDIETEDGEPKESRFGKIYNKFDITLDSMLDKIYSIIEKISNLFKDLFKFMKQSIEKKQLKKVFLILIMSISMAILFVGINVIFGKVIL